MEVIMKVPTVFLVVLALLSGCSPASVPVYEIRRNERNGNRATIRLEFEEDGLTPDQVRSALTYAAKSSQAEIVRVYGYRPGTYSTNSPTAGVLEWSTTGKGWNAGERVPPDGIFLTPPRR
jgi:hypothetical protein